MHNSPPVSAFTFPLGIFNFWAAWFSLRRTAVPFWEVTTQSYQKAEMIGGGPSSQNTPLPAVKSKISSATAPRTVKTILPVGVEVSTCSERLTNSIPKARLIPRHLAAKKMGKRTGRPRGRPKGSASYARLLREIQIPPVIPEGLAAKNQIWLANQVMVGSQDEVADSARV